MATAGSLQPSPILFKELLPGWSVMGESLATGLVDSFCGAITFLYGSKPCPSHVSGKRARKILHPDQRENTGETGVSRQKNQKKIKSR